MQFYNRISQIENAYDAFIVDLWGIVHDGQTLYPHAIETLKVLKSLNKHILFLTNAPRRSSRIIQALEQMGIERHLYKDAVSSGEVCYHHFLHPEQGSFFQGLSDRYLFIGPERDKDLLAGLNFTATSVASEASFALAVGFDYDHSTLLEKMPELEAALAAGLPMLCVNPDRIVVRITGERCLCAGILGEAYAALGGTVHYFGKPYAAMYDACFKLLPGIDKSRIAAIGDSLETDIRGATQNKIDSILVTGGILAEELGITPYQTADREKLNLLCEAQDVMPTYVLPAFI